MNVLINNSKKLCDSLKSLFKTVIAAERFLQKPATY